MAIAQTLHDLSLASYLTLVIGTLAACFSAVLLVFTRRQPLQTNAPKRVSNDIPILGAFSFFTRRWDFHHHNSTISPSGQFSYYVGSSPVIGLTGPAGRSTYFESRELGLGAGYKRLFAAGPAGQPENEDDQNSKSFDNYFMKRLAFLVKNEQLAKRLPFLLADSRACVDQLAAVVNGDSVVGETDPFDSVYRLVFGLTVRTVGCNDIAADPALLKRVLAYYEHAGHGTSALSTILPWLPTLGKLKRQYAGTRIYLIIKSIANGRKASGKKDDDPLQHLIDSGDTTLDMTMFMISAFFAGILNSGVNAAAVLCYLASSPQWQERCYVEICELADKHSTHPSASSASLVDKLMHVPLVGWESGLPILDACFRDSIRLQLPGTGFRRNTSTHDVLIGKEGGEVIPPGAYATLHFQEVHLDPSVYPEPTRWDPSRYLREDGSPVKENDAGDKYAWTGFGAGRHPCAGMRFARLEQNIITALFLAHFQLLSLNHARTGKKLQSLPDPDINNISATRAKNMRIRYRLRRDA